MKDATIEIIKEVKTHPNADKLELAFVLGFQCVVMKGLYKGGEKIVYIRPDAVLPLEEWAEPYRQYSPKRIKAVKLRNEWSEGIIIPLDKLPYDLTEKNEGDDVTDIIKVIHYEPPVPQELNAKGYLPFGIGMTDEERFENLSDEKLPIGELVDVTLKIDGQTCSFYYDIETDTFGVLGRKLELYEDSPNNYTDHIKRYDIKNKLIGFCKKHDLSLCIRGESYGLGIQNGAYNPHSKQNKGWMMFSSYNMKDRRYYHKGEEFYYEKIADELNLPRVPLIEFNVPLTKELIKKYSEEQETINSNYFEGVVIKYPRGSFKIMNKFYDSKK